MPVDLSRLRLDYLIDPSCRLYQDPKAFCLNSDSAALALFVPDVKNRRVLEIGCNNAAILLWLDRQKPAFLCGIEIQPDAARLARYNLSCFARSPWQVVTGSVLDVDVEGFDVVLCNPPYFPLPAGKSKETLSAKEFARFETDLSIEALCRHAAEALRSQGRFVCVHRPERLDELLAALHQNRLQPSRLKMACDGVTFAVRAVLVEAVKEGTMHMRVEEPFFYDRSSTPKSGRELFGNDKGRKDA